MTDPTKKKIKKLITEKVKAKLKAYSGVSVPSPFIKAILSDHEIFITSFGISIYTMIGMSLYEQIGKIIVEDSGAQAERQYKLLGNIDQETLTKISEIWENAKANGGSNKVRELEIIRKYIKSTDNPIRYSESVVDLYVKKPDGSEYYFDITTVKPNKDKFETLKRKMLLWGALRLSTNKNQKVGTYFAIPYNPYYPKPYNNWNTKCLDLKGDVMVQEDFWNFLGNSETTYEELIELFSEIGIELRKLVKKFLKQYS